MAALECCDALPLRLADPGERLARGARARAASRVIARRSPVRRRAPCPSARCAHASALRRQRVPCWRRAPSCCASSRCARDSLRALLRSAGAVGLLRRVDPCERARPWRVAPACRPRRARARRRRRCSGPACFGSAPCATRAPRRQRRGGRGMRITFVLPSRRGRCRKLRAPCAPRIALSRMRARRSRSCSSESPTRDRDVAPAERMVIASSARPERG